MCVMSAWRGLARARHWHALRRDLLQGVDAQQHRCAALDVAVTNPRARSLYEKLGFVADALRASSLQNRLGRVPDHYRMSRPAGG